MPNGILDLIEDLVRLGKRTGAKVAMKVLPFTLAANETVQNAVVGAAVQLEEQIRRKNKGKKPLRGWKRGANKALLVADEAKLLATKGVYTLFGAMLEAEDYFTDVLLGNSTADALIDIPEELLQDAIGGLKRINERLLEERIKTRKERLRR